MSMPASSCAAVGVRISGLTGAIPFEDKALSSVEAHGLQQPCVEPVRGSAFFLAVRTTAETPGTQDTVNGIGSGDEGPAGTHDGELAKANKDNVH
jgi:hypothetical protein